MHSFDLYLRLGSCKGAHKTSKNEFKFFLKSDDSALELLELLVPNGCGLNRT